MFFVYLPSKEDVSKTKLHHAPKGFEQAPRENKKPSKKQVRSLSKALKGEVTNNTKNNYDKTNKHLQISTFETVNNQKSPQNKLKHTKATKTFLRNSPQNHLTISSKKNAVSPQRWRSSWPLERHPGKLPGLASSDSQPGTSGILKRLERGTASREVSFFFFKIYSYFTSCQVFFLKG